MKERSQEKLPQIIAELNANLGAGETTVESIAEKVGISKATLYRWVKYDSEFLEALEIVKEVQNDNPFKTGTEEDVRVNQMIVALLLLETKDRLFGD
jgi:AcrR family transcriptional regulator